MKMKAITAAILAAGLLGACTVPTPVVTKFNGDSITIRANSAMQIITPEARVEMRENATAQANDVCRRGQRKRAEYVSAKFYEAGEYDYGTEYLFLCLN